MIHTELQFIDVVRHNLSVVTTPYSYAIAQGFVEDHYSRRIVGLLDPTTTSRRDISSLGVDIIPVPATAITMEVVGAAADTAAGVGAQEVEIIGLNRDWNEIQEKITMNGIAAVACVHSYRRINDIHVSRTGTNGIATGPISIQATGGGTVYNRIPAGRNATRQCQFTVPSGKCAYITGWNAGATGKETILDLRATLSRYDFRLQSTFNLQDTMSQQGSTTWKEFPVPVRCPAMCDIKVSAEAKVAGGTASSSIEIWIQDEAEFPHSFEHY